MPGSNGPDLPDLRTIARRLAMSTRTLRRRLETHGTTCSAELKAARRTRGLHMLRTTDLPLGAVADRAGCTGARVLRRAVRRWTAHTNTEWRRGSIPEGARKAG